MVNYICADEAKGKDLTAAYALPKTLGMYTGYDVHTIAKVGKKVVGAIFVGFYDDVCFDVFVLPEYQKQGIGRALVEDVLSYYEDCGVGFYAQCVNPVMAKMLAKMGFVSELKICDREDMVLR